MSKAIGMIEFKTTATGVTAADAMVKTSDVEIYQKSKALITLNMPISVLKEEDIFEKVIARLDISHCPVLL